jgi:N-methylhydantoinase B
MYKLIDRCAGAIRELVLPQIPDGEWTGEDFCDSDGITHERPVKQVVTLRKDAEKILLDWTGTDDQVEGPINFPATGRFVTKWLGGYVKQFAPGVTINEGICRVMRSYHRPRSIMSPEFPAPCANRSQTNLRNTSAFSVCLAQALEGQVVADSNTLQIYGFYGVLENGEDFILREVFGAGSGARPYADGTDAVDLVPNAKNLPSEFIEQRFPVVVERTALNPDSGGPGLHRGGLGYLKEIRVLVDGFLLTCCDRTAFGCWGVAGGRAGKPGGSFVNPDTSAQRVVQFSQEAVPVRAGDVIRVTTPGGGGWGSPLERDPEAVRLDVQRRLVSQESAERDYGVVLERRTSGLTTVVAVEEGGTARLRERLAASSGPPALIHRGEYAERLKAEGRITFDEHIAPLSEVLGHD